MRRSVLSLILLVGCFAGAAAQSKSIDKMKAERAEMQKKIAQQEKLLVTTEKNISSQLSNLKLISARLRERTQLLEQTRRDIRQLDQESASLRKDIEKLQDEFDACVEHYADACRFYQKERTSFNAMTFLLSSDSFRQLGRRMRYVTEYSGALADLGKDLADKRDTLQARKDLVDSMRVEKARLQDVQQKNEREVRNEESQQKSLVDKLKKQQSNLNAEIKSQQKKMDALSKEIDRQIELALEEERKKNSKNSTAQKGTQAKNAQEVSKLTGSFESNKGKLPIPITGPYLIVGRFGVQEVAGMKNVKLNNLGIDIQGEKGCQARVVFDGEVSSVFQQGKGQIGVLVRHGSYISVYCNLAETSVKKGDKLKTGDSIGKIQISDDDTYVLHFQLHKENVKLDPSQWLKK